MCVCVYTCVCVCMRARGTRLTGRAHSLQAGAAPTHVRTVDASSMAEMSGLCVGDYVYEVCVCRGLYGIIPWRVPHWFCAAA